MGIGITLGQLLLPINTALDAVISVPADKNLHVTDSVELIKQTGGMNPLYLNLYEGLCKVLPSLHYHVIGPHDYPTVVFLDLYYYLATLVQPAKKIPVPQTRV